jgi:hypothetical protein
VTSPLCTPHIGSGVLRAVGEDAEEDVGGEAAHPTSASDPPTTRLRRPSL